jgi:glutaconate CoA-transferase subunit A
MITSPYEDAEELVAMPALPLDAALIHVNRADATGSGQILGPDPFFDELFLGAAERRYVTTERIIDTEQFAAEGPIQTMCISRLLTDGVVETPGGAHFTACVPDYVRDEEFQKAYVSAAGDPDLWAAFRRRYLDVDEAGYQSATEEFAAERAAPRTGDDKQKGVVR